MFDCLLLLGDELGNYYDECMRKAQGEHWLRMLAHHRNDYNLTLHDPDFVIKEPLRSDSPLRSILPKTPSFYKNLDILRRIRNHIAHNKIEGSYEQTREILEILLSVSMDIDLKHCVNEYAGAIRRLEDLDLGTTFHEESSTGNRVEDFEDKSAEIEEMLFEEKEKSAQIAHLLEEARSIVVIKELEFEALYESEQAKTVAVQKMEAELNRARQEAEELKIQLEENIQKTEDLKKNEINLKNLVASLALPLDETAALNELRNDERRDQVNGQAKQRTAKLPSIQEAGTLWEQPKGNKKVVLSVSSRDLVDIKNGKLLEKADPTRTKELAEKWLKIRPQGGRVFIDSDGHASTLIDDRLVYLGNVTGLLN
jgi:myosin heavy subunit